MADTPCDREVLEGLKPHYRSGQDDLVEEFFRPCMQCCTGYDRAVGFFTSSSLLTWSKALPRFVERDDLTIRLLISPHLTEKDRDALRRSQNERERAAFLQEIGDVIVEHAVQFAEDPSRSDLRAKLLLWLVATSRLKIRFAFPQHLSDAGLYHEKIGVFSFPWDEQVAFTGSANETASGHTYNYESLDIYRSWAEGDQERVAQKQTQFEEAWEGRAAGIAVLPPSPETLERVKVHAPDEPPGEASGPTVKSGKLGPEPPGSRWRHQDEAVAEFLEKKRGVLEMATGTGKTRTALKIMARLLDSGAIDTIVVATDGTDLLDQWASELLWFTAQLDTGFRLLRHYAQYHERELFVESPTKSIFLSSRRALAPGLRELEETELERSLLVHDEVQGLGSPATRDALSGLSDPIQYRLGLSATPEREYDEEGTEFIFNHIGPIIFQFDLADAIRRGILVPFDYYPLSYEPSEDDKRRLAGVFRQKAARQAEGDPMSEDELAQKLARVHKTSEAKLPVFRSFIAEHPDLLERCIIFVETVEYGDRVLEVVHRYRYDFHTYFAGVESQVLDRFARGQLECLITCHRLSEGIDIQNLRTVILFSSAKSRLETIQRIGRCLRKDPSDERKRAQVVDFVRHDDREEQNTDQERREWLAELAAIEPQE